MFGFHAILKDGIPRILNLGLIILGLTLHTFITTMSIWTILFIADKQTIIIQNTHTFFFVACAVTMPIIKFKQRTGLKGILKSLKEGFFVYEREEDNEIYFKIKRERVKEIRLLSSVLINMTYVASAANALQTPIVHYFGSSKSTEDDKINTDLPFPIYMPFNTTTVHGLTVAAVVINVWLFIFFLPIVCSVIVYYSLGLQLIAQMNILHYSLKNIENRAVLKYKFEYNVKIIDDNCLQKLYDNSDFQRCQYLCLRDNIKHHQAILR